MTTSSNKRINEVILHLLCGDSWYDCLRGRYRCRWIWYIWPSSICDPHENRWLYEWVEKSEDRRDERSFGDLNPRSTHGRIRQKGGGGDTDTSIMCVPGLSNE